MTLPMTLVSLAPHVPGSTVTFPAPGIVLGGVHPAGIVNVTGVLPALFEAVKRNEKLFVLPGTTNCDAGVTVNVCENGAAVSEMLTGLALSPKNSFTASNALPPPAAEAGAADRLIKTVSISMAPNADIRLTKLECVNIDLSGASGRIPGVLNSRIRLWFTCLKENGLPSYIKEGSLY